MSSVIQRHFVLDDEGIAVEHEDRPSTYERAEEIVGQRLDRRRNYAIIKGEVCTLVEWTDYCTGCTERGDYGALYGGSGCSECGYNGRRRRSYWCPFDANEEDL